MHFVYCYFLIFQHKTAELRERVEKTKEDGVAFAAELTQLELQVENMADCNDGGHQISNTPESENLGPIKLEYV